MTTMTIATTPAGAHLGAGPFTVDDLDALPDDGRRHELIDGLLVVSPAPTLPHQLALGALHVLLRGAATEEHLVVLAPFDVRLARDTNLQPDLVVARAQAFTDAALPTPPELAVEVRSPSTARYDRTWKLTTYERWRVPRYWIVDPDPEAPSVTVFTLDEAGRYDEGTTYAADDELRQEAPFPIAFRPAELVARPASRPDGGAVGPA